MKHIVRYTSSGTDMQYKHFLLRQGQIIVFKQQDQIATAVLPPARDIQ